jgi:hypothetical protein
LVQTHSLKGKGRRGKAITSGGGLELTGTSIGLAELGQGVIAQAIGIALAP